MDNTKEHQKLVDDILFAVGSLPRVRAWPRQVGFDYLRKIKFGLEGETDIDGIIAPSGRKLCIEVKTGTGRLSAAQKRYRDMVVKFGAVYVEARSVQDAVDAVQRAL